MVLMVMIVVMTEVVVKVVSDGGDGESNGGGD